MTEALLEMSLPPPPGEPYAVPLPGTGRPGRTPIYRHWRTADRELVSNLEPHIRTMHDMFDDAAAKYPNNNCLGSRPWNNVTRIWADHYAWETYSQVAERRLDVGAGLREAHAQIFVATSTGQKFGVGIWSQNRAEWEITGEYEGIGKRANLGVRTS
jgi:long-chain acyl-CoA synthetase